MINDQFLLFTGNNFYVLQEMARGFQASNKLFPLPSSLK